MNMDYCWLMDAQFMKLGPHLLTDTRGKLRIDDRRVISDIYRAILHFSREVRTQNLGIRQRYSHSENTQ